MLQSRSSMLHKGQDPAVPAAVADGIQVRTVPAAVADGIQVRTSPASAAAESDAARQKSCKPGLCSRGCSSHC